ncbi:hypothetical protein GGI25_003562 [Coemansia spiralis]|uniref:Transmembrane protein n=2 Tax=Coemansia TaxID=4863 RepID=A0A9W8G6V7_9FUNG|nr:eukaryotic integral membrane protein-domain-containing protein [Coemansia spiralis]KAJ1991118.1 hypothetical protein EDC05_003596 [Coemansia umbellata]KAJ2621305.1 hypothetical protein GGI26_004279 [Coemansia sp. RSA 1358]KAJ2676412.1 hypothetical protein GGI25_003562 [Coemansia spiralis]
MSSLLSHVGALPVVTKSAAVLYFTLSAAAILLRLRAETDLSTDPISIASQDPARFLILRPGFIISYPWTILTSAFVEPNPIFLALGLVTVASIGGFLERQWGPRGYLAFVLVVTAIPALTSAFIAIAAYAITSKSMLLYSTQLCGLPALVSGFAVGLKQLVPDYNVKVLKSALTFRMNDIPGLYTLVVPIIYSLLGSLGGVLLVNVGFFEAFIYLRFYKRNGSVRGDRSEAFAFTTFFPEFAHPLIGRVSNSVYNLAVSCKLVTSDEGYQQAISMEAGNISSSSSDNVVRETFDVPQDSPEESDADRRRALAAKALDVRLGATTASETPALASATPSTTADNK